jgi:hypothetical protein
MSLLIQSSDRIRGSAPAIGKDAVFIHELVSIPL